MQKSNLKEHIDNNVRRLLRHDLNKKNVTTNITENKSTTNITENVQAISKNYKMLREYIEYENEGEYNGDAMLEDEMDVIDANTPEINKFIENIKSEALDAMTQLSKNGESNTDTFETLKKVFDVCYNTQKKKDNKNEIPSE